MSLIYDCIVIGAGWSGAVAARSLASHGRRVLVLDARDRVGGRANTFTKGMHTPVDLGCSFIHGYREGNPAKEIAHELAVDTHVTQPTNAAVYDGSKRLSLEESNALSTSLSAALSSVSESTQLVSAPSGNMSLASAIFSVSSQLKNHAFARTLEVPYGIPLEDVALRWHGWSDNFAGSDAAPKGGFEALVSLVLADAQSRSAKVSLNSLVTSVAQTEGGVSVRTADGKEFKAKTVISTIPLGVLKRTASGLFKPLLPPRRLATIERTRVGILEKLALVYPNAWWPEANTTGSYTFLPTSSSTANLTGSAEEQAKRALDAHTISVASFAAPTLPNPHPTLLFYLSPGPALALADFSAEDAARGAHAFLVARFGLPATEVPQPIASTRSEWHKDPFAYGATSSPVAVGSDTSPLDFVELGKPLWNGMLGFAGEHTDADHRGSIAGAIKSGQREAERVELFLQRE